ncbi:uncharacterized protein LOC144478151, partial [Augochlora pura]
HHWNSKELCTVRNWILLHWLNSSLHTLKTFVANRVSEIQSNTLIPYWRHISSGDNPADLISRGQAVQEFLKPSIWQHGPTWLQRDPASWSVWEPITHVDDPEQKLTICMSTTTVADDNGTNFMGANNEFRELRDLLNSENHRGKINSFLADRAINWHFIPPSAPHFGGLWEAAVKSFKNHLKRVVGAELLTFENLNTLIIDIEAILNSRPLTPIFSDPADPFALTPGHFLIGDALTGLRKHDFRDIPSNRLSGWQRIQQLKQHFWKRWHREYLNELTIRNKWIRGQHPIIEGTIILLKEDNVPSM